MGGGDAQIAYSVMGVEGGGIYFLRIHNGGGGGLFFPTYRFCQPPSSHK